MEWEDLRAHHESSCSVAKEYQRDFNELVGRGWRPRGLPIPIPQEPYVDSKIVSFLTIANMRIEDLKVVCDGPPCTSVTVYLYGGKKIIFSLSSARWGPNLASKT